MMDWDSAQFSYQDWVEYLQPVYLKEKPSCGVGSSMLGNIASYLLGYGSPASPPAGPGPAAAVLPEERENWRLTAVQADGEEDWLVVDALPGSGARSRSSSLDSAVEESWFVTPPPVFTSCGPVSVETSPLENLLIEHPSMSVYHRVRRRSSSPPLAAAGGAAATPAAGSPAAPGPRRQPLRPANPPAAPASTPRHHPPPALAQAQAQVVLLKRAQKVQTVKESLGNKAKFLDRGNKVREYNKKTKKPRRSDRQLNHSGANNNRKSC